MIGVNERIIGIQWIKNRMRLSTSATCSIPTNGWNEVSPFHDSTTAWCQFTFDSNSLNRKENQVYSHVTGIKYPGCIDFLRIQLLRNSSAGPYVVGTAVHQSGDTITYRYYGFKIFVFLAFSQFGSRLWTFLGKFLLSKNESILVKGRWRRNERLASAPRGGNPYPTSTSLSSMYQSSLHWYRMWAD